MPQITQLPIIFFSQLFWLLLVFGIIYFVIGRGMVPKIRSTVETREKKIADDLARAQAARAAAEETEAAWRERMDAARAEGVRVANDARQASARETEAKVKKAVDTLNLKLDASQKAIHEARDKARAEIENVAADATQDLVNLLTGIKVEKKDAAAAVKAELNA